MSAPSVDNANIYADCIRKQLEEVNQLAAIYCNAGEMQILDNSIIIDFNEFLETCNAALLKAQLDLSIRITVNAGLNQETLYLRFELPHLYPVLQHPLVMVHTPLLSKMKEAQLKAALAKYIADITDKQDGYIYQLILWLQEQIEHLIANEEELTATTTEEQKLNFERLWIYSHHIKSKKKRQSISSDAHHLQLTGFLRPGKPGIICLEGLESQTQELWRSIRTMQWQKITLAHAEKLQLTSAEQLKQRRRFVGFQELLFEEDATTDDGVMNMSAFMKYLQAHNSGYMKKILFNIE